MALVRRVSFQDVFKLAILLALVTLSSNNQASDGDSASSGDVYTTTTAMSSTNSISSQQSSKNKQDTKVSCPSGLNCSLLGGECLDCNFNHSCVYGEEVKVMCSPKPDVDCLGQTKFERTMICQYCYQMHPSNYTCKLKANCNSVASPRAYYPSNCTVKSELLCLGNRMFLKNLPCNWTGGYKWSTALILSITLGGFGADRFYLGHWQEAIGKLFSFGGLGVWTLVDVVLIWLHYLGPADGSLYI